MAKFCDITSRNELADFLEIPRKVLTYVLYVKKVEYFYTSFEIPKKNGGTRTIKAPSGKLKSIQKKLASELERYQQDIWASKRIKPNMSHGFQKNKSIITKVLLLIVCCALVCSLSGCIVFRRGSSNAYRSDKELADEMIENIIGCAEKEDAKALTGLFSQYAGDSTLNLTEQAEEFIEFFQGECKSWKGNASSHEKSEHGKITWRELRGHYSVITDEAQYEIAYIYIPFYREEPDKEGLTAIEITTEETFNKDEFLWSLDQKPGIYVTETGEETYSEQRLITPEELIRAAGLTKEQYSKVDLEQFIEDFDITTEDVDTLNIPLLLEEYEPERKFGMYDVSYLIEDGIEERTSDFTENVYAVAFMENKNTSTECVYYDLPDRKRYQTSDAYLFDDLYQIQGGYYADGQQIIEALDKYGVFGWESGTGEEEITDPQHMVLAVLYDDGTVFRVEASGLLSQALPDEYDEVKEMLLSGEYSGS